VALFFALTGGVAWATHPGGANTISSEDIINGEVTAADIGGSEVTSGDIANAAVNRNKIADGAVSTTKIANGEVTTADVLDDSLRSADILDGQIRAIDVAFGTLRGDEILDGTIGGNDLVDDGVLGEDVNESTLGQVPSAAQAATANALERTSVYLRDNSITVPGGTQDDSNGNGISRSVLVFCDPHVGAPNDLAIGGGAWWSGNANSNSNEFENRIHSATLVDFTGEPANEGEIPVGYRVRGEVDKDGDDTLTAQVLCIPAN
jgi:hypothetical protein